jgi:hypothetical protein
MVFLALTAPASAQSPDSDPVRAGAAALRSSGSYPWYDSDQDQIRAVEVESSTGDAAHRASTWEVSPSSWNWPDWDLSGLTPVARFLGYVVLALVLVALAALIVRLFKNVRLPRAEPGELDEEVEKRGDIDRIEALPFPVLRQRGDLLEAARQAYLAGRYDDAIVCLFSYFLVRLDRAQLLRLARGKTNRQYLREVGWRSPAGDILAPTMVAFEDVYFGRHPLDRSRFEACWNRLDEFHSLVREEDQ